MFYDSFKDIEFISFVQEKYKLSGSLNSVFNRFHDLKFPKQSSELLIKLKFFSEKDDKMKRFAIN